MKLPLVQRKNKLENVVKQHEQMKSDFDIALCLQALEGTENLSWIQFVRVVASLAKQFAVVDVKQGDVD